MHPLREKILQRLMHEPSLSFNELWGHEGESNKFAYHLRVLEEDDFVKKTGDAYALSHEGKKYVAYVEGATGKMEKAPLIVVAVVIYDQEKDAILMMQRTKEPFYGFWTLPSGKMKADQYLYECAAGEVKTETGLTCDYAWKGLISTKTYNDGSLSYNHQIFIMQGTNPRGTLEERTREGENHWVARKDLPSLKTYPNMHYNIEVALGDRFRWLECDGVQQNDEFTDLRVLRDVVF